ncbi:MAG: hypothetical protein MHM6MM_006634 [Cercozoa sp. M6MM]
MKSAEYYRRRLDSIRNNPQRELPDGDDATSKQVVDWFVSENLANLQSDGRVDFARAHAVVRHIAQKDIQTVRQGPYIIVPESRVRACLHALNAEREGIFVDLETEPSDWSARRNEAYEALKMQFESQQNEIIRLRDENEALREVRTALNDENVDLRKLRPANRRLKAEKQGLLREINRLREALNHSATDTDTTCAGGAPGTNTDDGVVPDTTVPDEEESAILLEELAYGTGRLKKD